MGAGPGGSPDDWLVLGSVPVEPWLRFRSGLGPAQRGEASGGQADAGAEQQRRGHPVDERRPRARCKGSAVLAELPCDRESAADAFADRFDDLTGQPGEIRLDVGAVRGVQHGSDERDAHRPSHLPDGVVQRRCHPLLLLGQR